MVPDDPSKPAKEESFASLFAHSDTASARQRRLSTGEEFETTVIKVTHDAVFVDLDGKREAFIDAMDLVDAEGNRVELAVGARIKAKVVELGGRAGGVRLMPIFVRRPIAAGDEPGEADVEMLGPKQALSVGAKLKATVYRVEAYGAFLQAEGTSDAAGRGLLPLGETVFPRGTDARKHFTVGQELEVKLVGIDEQKRIRFSTKALLGDEERERFEQFRKEGGGGQGGGPKKGFGTLGDLLSAKKKK
ncbi:MAG: S1 RNA-binding domain-containing protein [Deltaproteobacteria bacterium]|nr:S1 RNA-binding domain-containing protein [Deltaproteobacteria bacterium]